MEPYYMIHLVREGLLEKFLGADSNNISMKLHKIIVEPFKHFM